MISLTAIELCHIEKLRELVKMEHRLVLTVFAKECDVLAEVHVLKVIGDKAAVAALDALAKLSDRVRFHYLTTPRFDVSMNFVSRSTSPQSAISSRIRSRACDVLSFEESSR